MAKRKPKRRKRNRDTAEKRLRAHLAANPGIGDSPDFYPSLERAGIEISARRVVQIKNEMGLLKRPRK